MFPCDQCDYKSKHKCAVTEHIKAVHQKVKPFQCAHCDFKASRKSNLREHINRHHQNSLNFKCKECKFTANNQGKLDLHIKAVHMLKKDFKCDECDYETMYKHHLKRHKISHEKTGFKRKQIYPVNDSEYEAKKFKCEKCPFRTDHKDSFRNHKRFVHEIKSFDFQCDKCNFVAKRSELLQRHVDRKHKVKKERPIKYRVLLCDQCEFKTEELASLNSHKKLEHAKIMTLRAKVDCNDNQKQVLNDGKNENFKEQNEGSDDNQNQVFLNETQNEVLNVTDTQNLLQDPLQIKEENIEYCEHCNFTSADLAEMANHICISNEILS